jgi:hypothetical protein
MQNRIVGILLRSYARLARLYPSSFREELAEEMTTTFSDLVQEAASHGRRSLGLALLRELRDLPGTLLREYWVAFKQGDLHVVDGEGGVEMVTSSGQYRVKPTPWGETILGSLFFLVTGLLFITLTIGAQLAPDRVDLMASFTLWCIFLIPVIGFTVGWIRGLPRWSYPYISSAIFMTAILMNEETVFGRSWGWLTWLPLVLAGAIAYLVTRSFDTFKNVPRNFQADRAAFTYTMFGLCPLLGMIWFEGENDLDYMYYLSALTLVLTGMAIIYLRSARLGPRVVALLAGFLVSALVPSLTAHIAWYGLSWVTIIMGVLDALFAGLIFFSPLIFLQFERWETRKAAT